MAAAPVPSERIADHPDIFISYRRQEASYQAAWLHDALSHRFGRNSVFLDIDCIRPGVDYLDEIEEILRRCSVLILVVGQHWLQDSTGRSRIDDPEDPVRLEIELALKLGMNLIPVLLDGAVMPGARQLPPSINRIARINAIALRREGASADMRSLLAAVGYLRGDKSDDGDRAPPESLNDPARWTGPAAHRESRVHEGKLSDQRLRLLSQLTHLFQERVQQSVGDSTGVRIALELELCPELTYRASDQFLGIQGPQRQVLQDGTNLLDVFDRSRGLLGDGLLLVGGPGSGKTSMLFEMAAGLVERARADPAHPIPVYLALQSWSDRRQALTDWAVAEMHKLYLVPMSLGRRWVEDGQIMLLLDGLDEISNPILRRQCAEEINRFDRFGRQVRVPTIVASRAVEYGGARMALQLETAVQLRPLDPVSVLEGLTGAAGPAGAMARVVDDNPALLDLLSSPLLITMLRLSLLPEDPEGPLPAAQSLDPALMVDYYLERRLSLERRQSRLRRNVYPPELTRRYLAILAAELTRGRQTVFLPDHLPLDLVASRPAQRLIRLGPPLLWTVGFGLAAGVAFLLVAQWGIGPSNGFLSTVLAFSLLGLIAGLAARQNMLRRTFIWLGFGLTLGITAGVFQPEIVSVADMVSLGLLLAVFFGLLGELAVRLLGGDLPLVGSISFSWVAVRHYAPRSCLIGVVFALLYNVPNWIANGLPITEAVLLGLFFGLILGMFVGTSLGFGRGVQVAPIPLRIHPNAEVRASARIGLTIGLLTAVIVGGAFFLSGLVGGVDLAIVRAITWGPGAGLLWGLATGLGAVCQYWLTRLMLWRDGIAPLHLLRWLEYGVHLRVLYRAGGGYVFIHRTLQEALTQDMPPRRPNRP